MTFGRGEIHQASFAQQINLAIALQHIFIHQRPHFPFPARELFQRGNIDFHVEMPGVANHRAALHGFEVLAANHALVSGYGNKNVAFFDLASAAEASLCSDRSIPSGARAQHNLIADGTAEAVPFPSVLATRIELGEKSYDEPSEADRYQMIRTYFEMLIEEELPDAIGKMKQFASWFTHGVPGGAGLRKAIYESKSALEILSRVEEFFEARLCGAGTLVREV